MASSSSSNCLSLKEIIKNRIFDEVLGSIDGWKVVVTDKYSLKVLNACCRMDDIGDMKVSLVEDLMKKRQPYPNQNAIYFITPLMSSVDAIIKDLDQPCYKGYYIFFTTGVPDELFDKISKHRNSSKYIKAFCELYCDFIPFESQVFTFERLSSFYHLYSPNSREFLLEIDFIANKLASVCASLGEYPIIRFSAKSTAPDRLNARLAALLQNKMDLLLNKKAISISNDRPRAVLFILDRSFDVITPLVHEFTYQAMANDLLPIQNGNLYKQTIGKGGEAQAKDVVLDERDSIWANVRHMHISDAIQVLLGNFQKFLQDNPAAKNHLKSNGGESTTATLKEMRETISSLPQFQELKGQFESHINMSGECMKEFGAKNLENIAEAEQNMATGYNADGSVVDCPITDIVSILCDPKVSNYDKARLIILYIICKEGLKESDRKALMSSAKLSADDISAISNISYLGIKLSQGSTKKKSMKKKKAKKRSDDVSYELSRYSPNLKYFLEDYFANGTVDMRDYPFIKESDAQDEAEGNGGGTKKAITSLRGSKPSWQTKGGAGAGKESGSRPSSNSSRVIIFVAGGVTFSEMRVAYELSQSSNREIYLGGTGLVTPMGFLDSLRDLKRAERIEIPTDRDEPPLGISPPAGGGSDRSLDKIPDNRRGSGGNSNRKSGSKAISSIKNFFGF